MTANYNMTAQLLSMWTQLPYPSFPGHKVYDDSGNIQICHILPVLAKSSNISQEFEKIEKAWANQTKF